MTPWLRLGINQNASKREIKRAYSHLIKKHRPDESPTEFQEIRDAYETMIDALSEETVDAYLELPLKALQPARPLNNLILQAEMDQLLAQSPTPDTEVTAQPEAASEQDIQQIDIAEVLSQIETEEQIQHRATEEHPKPRSITDPSREISTFLTDVDLLIKQFADNRRLPTDTFERYRVETVDLMHRSILNNWQARELISDSVFKLLCERIDISSGFLSTTTNIPSQLLHYFDRHFLWSDNEIALRESCADDSAGLIFYSIHEANNRDLPKWEDAPSSHSKLLPNRLTASRTIGQRIKAFFRNKA